MKLLEHDVWNIFQQFFYDELTLVEFEQWIYSTEDIGEIIGEDRYLDFISFSYQKPSALAELKKLVSDTYEQACPSGLVRKRVQRILCGFIDGTFNVVAGCRELTQLYHHGHTWIPIIFVGLDSELDIVPPAETHHLWNQEALAAKLADLEPLISEHGNTAKTEAIRFLAEYFPDEACS